MQDAKNWVSEHGYVCAIICVVVVLIIILFMMRSKAEHALDQNLAYTSGSTQRFFGEFSGSNQGPYETGYNFETGGNVLTQKIPLTAAPGPGSSGAAERLTGFSSDPDEWQVGNDLGFFKNDIIGQTPGLDPNRNKIRIENLYEGDPTNDVYERLLQNQLYIGA